MLTDPPYTVAAGVQPLPARAVAQGIFGDAEGVGVLQRLHRRVQRVGHVRVHRRRAGGVLRRARAAAAPVGDIGRIARGLAAAPGRDAERVELVEKLARGARRGRSRRARHPRARQPEALVGRQRGRRRIG